MDNPASFTEQGPGERRLTIPVLPSDLGSGEEHVAALADFGVLGPLRRWDDLLDEGVAAVFGIKGGVAHLVCLCFHGGRFTPAEAAAWLAERDLKPLSFVSYSGSFGSADFDTPPASRLGTPCLPPGRESGRDCRCPSRSNSENGKRPARGWLGGHGPHCDLYQ